MAKLRAVIWGVTEYEEAACDYKQATAAAILTAQREIGREDPISFVNPDNVHVTVELALPDSKVVAYPDVLGVLRTFAGRLTPAIQPEAIADERVRAHWVQARFHLDQLGKLLNRKEKK